MFEHRLRVRFQEVDRAGIAFYGRVFEYVHNAFEEMILSLGLSLDDFFMNEDWVFPIVHANADFKRPMRQGMELTIEVEITKIGSASMTVSHRIRSDAGVHAIAKTIHVSVDRRRFESCPIPDKIRAAFTPHLAEGSASTE